MRAVSTNHIPFLGGARGARRRRPPARAARRARWRGQWWGRPDRQGAVATYNLEPDDDPVEMLRPAW